mgnify:CR=1 FL=1
MCSADGVIGDGGAGVLMVAAAICLIKPGFYTDAAGIALALIAVVGQSIERKRAQADA